MKEVQKLRELLAEYERLYARMEEIEAMFEKIGVVLEGGRIRRKPTKKKKKKKKATGNTDIQAIITERVKAGECRCEETNPSGGCCLGAVAKAIKHAQALKDQGLLG